jgi:hypothetical protein
LNCHKNHFRFEFFILIFAQKKGCIQVTYLSMLDKSRTQGEPAAAIWYHAKNPKVNLVASLELPQVSKYFLSQTQPNWLVPLEFPTTHKSTNKPRGPL